MAANPTTYSHWMISFTPGAHSSCTEHHPKLLWAGIGQCGRLGEWCLQEGSMGGSTDSSCFHILDFSHFFPAPRPPCQPETPQTHQLLRASANHFVWNSGDVWHVPVGFDPSPVPGSRGAGLPKVIAADLQVNPGLSQRASLQNTLWSLWAVREATRGSARHINSSTVKRSCSTGLSQGYELPRDLWHNRFAPYHELWSHSLCRISESRCLSLGCAQCEKPIICLVDFPISCSGEQNSCDIYNYFEDKMKLLKLFCGSSVRQNYSVDKI